ncbi:MULTISPECIES: type VII secretion-associated serine protease mycosin [unclassified Streptomyces]|uniref:type VII secretion-associated serine protease mycosin n=1 Tax=unclassified Streptomyces TaxID=2593676 RepID=UPI002E3023E3|nr:MULTISPECIES: type VII secretion-associated serine protease mycosin [unclassified Streptomyces]WUC66255.1 type VII secretion-associated serine protease mycosin [Streptomyces sp. NBC_00539]
MRMRKATSALVGLLLAGVAATPAEAETVRSTQWHLDAMKADDIWTISTGKGVTVAVIDTGVKPIPELDGQVLPGKNFASPSYKGDERTDHSHHGTAIAAVIAGNGKGPGGADSAFGLAPGANILPLRVDFGGDGTAPFRSMIQAIRFAADSDAKVINVSVGGINQSDELDSAVKYAVDKGKLIFASVGNDGNEDVIWPAATPGVVGVGAVDAKGVALKESQHNRYVDVTAPGKDIISGCDGGTGLCKSSGTSEATALVSASAALLWSIHPDWSNNQILRVLLNTAGKPKDGAQRNDYVGYGLVRPRIAVPTPGDPGPADVYPLPDLAAAASPAPAPAAPGGKASPAPKPEAQKSGSDNGSALPWIALGLGACLIIGGAVTAVVIQRSRR